MRIRYIDVLKALAIIAVLLFHSGFWKYGYLGVDLFLVISGYMTTKSIIGRSSTFEDSKWGGYFKFECSRVLRLLPLVLLAGTVSLLIGFFIMIDDTYESLSQSVVASNFFANNV